MAEQELERHRHEDTSRALAKSLESRAHAEAEVARLSRRLEEERGGAGGARAALAAEREAARLAREEAEDARTAVAELDAAVAELGAQKRVLVAGLRSRERALGDRCASAEARAEEAAMMRRAAEARVRELEEEAERREAAQADGEIRLQRLRAEKKVLLAEVRRGSGAGAAGAGLAVSPRGGAGDRGGGDGGVVGREGGLEGARGRGGAGDAVGGGGSSSGSRKGSFSPRSSRENAQDNKVRVLCRAQRSRARFVFLCSPSQASLVFGVRNIPRLLGCSRWVQAAVEHRVVPVMARHERGGRTCGVELHLRVVAMVRGFPRFVLAGDCSRSLLNRQCDG